MSDPAVTTAWARAFVDELARMGVAHVCVCPGSRSTPLVMAIAGDERLTTWVHVDERSAGFFALGIGKVTGVPAAVLTTSGTATANLYPAVVEASLSGVPLLLVTADRPLRLRGSDANQTIEQEGLYGVYPRESFNLGDPSMAGLVELRRVACRAVGAALAPDGGPVHVNLPFDKPLEPVELDRGALASIGVDPLGLDGRPDGTPIEPLQQQKPHSDRGDDAAVLVDFLKQGTRGLIVAGPTSRPERDGPALLRLAEATGFPLVADPLSGARFCGPGGSAVISAADLFLRDPSVRELVRPDVIVRVGAPPTSAGVLGFLEGCRQLPQMVVSDTRSRTNALADHSLHLTCDVASTLVEVAETLESPVAPGAWTDRWERLDVISGEAASRSSGDFFEGDVLAAVMESIPHGATLFVSNSLPIRDLDAYGGAAPKQVFVYGNRGASGIDGIVSTAAGIAAVAPVRPGGGLPTPVVAVLGDLAFHHDMNGLLAVAQGSIDVLYVVINNDGGGIFHMLPVRDHEPEFTRYFATPHGLDFRHAAELYGIPYRLLDDGDRLSEVLHDLVLEPGPRILEIRTDRIVSQQRHAQVIEEVAHAVSRALEAK